MKYTTSPAAVDRAGKGSAWDLILLNMSAPPRPDGPEPDGMTTLDEGLDSPTEDAGASAEELQEVEKKPMQFEGTSLPQYVSARRSNRKDLGVMRAFDPPPEPNIAAICRDTYQATWTQREQLGTETAYRRHERDVAMRRKTRKKAAAWRRASEARDKQEHEQLKAEREAQELAKQKEQELVNHRIKMRKIRWLLVMKRLNEETRSKREETAASLRIDMKRKAQVERDLKRKEKQSKEKLSNLYWKPSKEKRSKEKQAKDHASKPSMDWGILGVQSRRIQEKASTCIACTLQSLLECIQ